MSIAFEEIDESSFWLENISDLELIKKDRLEALHKEAVELSKILASARKNSQ